MSAIEQRARELLARMEKAKRNERGHWCDARAAVDSACEILPQLIAALTPPEGFDQSLLELAATFETCIPFLPPAGQRNIGKAVAQLRAMAMGFVLVPVEPTEAMVDAGRECGSKFVYERMIAARPEVP